MRFPLDSNNVACQHSNTEIEEYIRKLQKEKTDRPTVAISLQYSNGDFAIFRQNTGELNWSFIQEGIKPNETHLMAAYRGVYEEACVTADMVEVASRCLYSGTVPRGGHPFRPPYTGGTWYVCVGMRLREGCEVSLAPSGRRQELLETRRLPFAEAYDLLLEQPGARLRGDSTVVFKTRKILHPALEMMHSLAQK